MFIGLIAIVAALFALALGYIAEMGVALAALGVGAYYVWG